MIGFGIPNLAADVFLSSNASYVSKSLPNENFGGSVAAEIGGVSSSTRQTLCKWDVSSYPVNRVNEITNVVIRFKKAYGWHNGSGTIGLEAVNASWIEGNGGTDNSPVNELTWNNQPAESSTQVAQATFRDSDPPNMTYAFSGTALTALVQNWVSNSAPNYGIRLYNTTAQGTVALQARESATPAYFPKLSITLSNGSIVALTSSSDVYTSKGDAAGNYGNATAVLINNSNGAKKFGYIRWDVSSISSSSVVTSATISLYRSYSQGNFPVTVSLHGIQSAWDEQSLTWNQKPPVDSTSVASAIYDDSDAVNKLYEFSSPALTQLVKDWITGTRPNNGVQLNKALEPGTIGFHSDEQEDLRLRPELYIAPSSFAVATPAASEVTVDLNPALPAVAVNRKVMGAGLLYLDPAKNTSVLNALNHALDDTSARAWAHVKTSDYWNNSVMPLIEGMQLDSVNGVYTKIGMATQAQYVSASDNNLPDTNQASYLANWISFIVNKVPYNPFSGWEIWNEPQNKDTGSWPSTDFARYVLDCSTAIKALYPDMAIGAPLYENNQEWNEEMLGTIHNANPSAIQFAVTHPYEFHWQKAREDMGTYYSRVSGAEVMRTERIRPKIELLNSISANQWGLVASEWGIHPDDSSQPPYYVSTDMAAAINVAGMLKVFWEEGVEAANFFNLRSPNTEGHFSMMNSEEVLYPTGLTFALFGKYFRGYHVPATMVTPVYTYKNAYMTDQIQIPVISANASYDSAQGSVCIVLTNRHIDAEAAVSIRLQHFVATGSSATVASVLADAPESTSADLVETTKPINSGANPIIQVDLPPHSIVCVVVSGTRF